MIEGTGVRERAQFFLSGVRGVLGPVRCTPRVPAELGESYRRRTTAVRREPECPALEGADTTPFSRCFCLAQTLLHKLRTRQVQYQLIQHFPAFHNTVGTSSVYQP